MRDFLDLVFVHQIIHFLKFQNLNFLHEQESCSYLNRSMYFSTRLPKLLFIRPLVIVYLEVKPDSRPFVHF